mmetsp:Transcript_19714/g.64024  ORF Transcript_19714/g.64024 Transcript_19714/m.64024 type:complete len:203 (+) Transcript_19714:139-747(+)
MRLGGIGRSAAAARSGACTGTLRASHTPLAGPRSRHPEGDFKLRRERRPHVGGAGPPRSEGRRSRHVELGGEVLVVARDNRVDVLGERLSQLVARRIRVAASREVVGHAPLREARHVHLLAKVERRRVVLDCPLLANLPADGGWRRADRVGEHGEGVEVRRPVRLAQMTRGGSRWLEVAPRLPRGCSPVRLCRHEPEHLNRL